MLPNSKQNGQGELLQRRGREGRKLKRLHTLLHMSPPRRVPHIHPSVQKKGFLLCSFLKEHKSQVLKV